MRHEISSVDDTDRSTIDEILRFWFGDLPEPGKVDPAKLKLWWSGGETVDAEIRERFGAKVEQALDGKFRHWTESPRGCLAFVILLDQFTRSVGRGSASAFDGDSAALDVCLAAIQRGFDRQLSFVERSFLYMPMMHAEDQNMARRSVETFGQLSKEIAALGRNHPDFHSHALTHAEIVLRFGRYPHRNEVLGRTPTADESEFVASGGPSFGQKKG